MSQVQACAAFGALHAWGSKPGTDRISSSSARAGQAAQLLVHLLEHAWLEDSLIIGCNSSLILDFSTPYAWQSCLR